MIIEAQPRTDGCMNVLQVLDVIRDLSHSQGFYSRLYETILEVKQNDEAAFNEFAKAVEAQNFRDSVDVVLFFET